MSHLPARLSTEPEGGQSAEARAGALLRRMGTPAAGRRGPRPRPRLRPGVVGGLVVILVGTGVLGGRLLGPRDPRPGAAPAGPAAPAMAAGPAVPVAPAPVAPAPLAVAPPASPPAAAPGWPRLRHGHAVLAGGQELLLAEGPARLRAGEDARVALELTPGETSLELAVRVLQGSAALITVGERGIERVDRIDGTARFRLTPAGVRLGPAALPPRRAPRPQPVPSGPGPAPGPGPGPAPAAPDPLGEESRLLAEAQARLARGAAAEALERLDELGRRFPAGALGHEADLLRLASWQKLGRSDRVLALLERLPLAGQARRLELTVLRGELRAQAGRCAQAVADFDRVLAGGDGLPGTLAERALHGRAACRLRLGRQAEGRADLEAYLARFPAGPRAAEVRQRLAAPAPPP